MGDMITSLRRKLSRFMHEVLAGGRGRAKMPGRRPRKAPAKTCGQCRKALGRRAVRSCRGCGLVLHDSCFEAPAGGYKTPGCRGCHERLARAALI